MAQEWRGRDRRSPEPIGGGEWENQQRPLVTTELLDKAKIPGLPYEQPDGTPYRLDTDYFGKSRESENPNPGPFAGLKRGRQLVKVWPRS